MVQYKAGVQPVEDLIKDFIVVASGTVATTTGLTTITTPIINKPSKLYRNYILVLYNRTGQSVATVSILGSTALANYPLPNTPAGLTVFVRANMTPSSGGTSNVSTIDLTSEEPNLFIVGNAKFQFNFGATLTANGSIDWALIGY